MVREKSPTRTLLDSESFAQHLRQIKAPVTIEELVTATRVDEEPVTVGMVRAFGKMFRKKVERGQFQGSVAIPRGFGQKVMFYPEGWPVPVETYRITSTHNNPHSPYSDVLSTTDEITEVTNLTKKLSDLVALANTLQSGLLSLYEELLLKDQELARLHSIKVPQLSERARNALRRAGIVYGD